jgi:hypothetical protein
MRSHDDPPELWEYPVSREVASFLARRMHFTHPFVPHVARLLPEGAYAELRESCGIRKLSDLFVVPEHLRGTGDGRTIVKSPMQVLGFGEDAVGLWVRDFEPRVPIVIPVEHIAGTVDLHQAMYGWLRIHSAAQTLTLRYNAVAHEELRLQLLRLRRLLWRRSGTPQMAVPDDHHAPRLPRSWRLLAGSYAVRLKREAPIAILSENLEASTIRRRPRGHSRRPWLARKRTRGSMAALTPGELVIATEYDEYAPETGLRIMHLPRTHIDRIAFGDSPWVSARGLEFPLPLSSHLAARLADTLSQSGQAEIVDA